MKKIGFVDFYLSEWHANNYPKWIKEANERLGTDYALAYAWAEKEISPLDGISTDGWCEKFGVQKCETLDELCAKSDRIIVLAPSNPEKHLLYAKTVFKYGKRTYIDKTFAPDVDSAEQMFALSAENGAPFFSTSALRYASELSGLENSCTRVAITGGGSNFDEYIIHQIEMLVKCLGTGADGFEVSKEDECIRATVSYPDKRVGYLSYSPSLPFSLEAQKNGASAEACKITSSFFDSLIEEILKFFESGIVPFSLEETREVMIIREKLVSLCAQI